MVNGVLEIVAGVLFSFVYLTGDRNQIWLFIGGVYFAAGVLNLIIYVIRNKTRLHAVKKQAEKSAKEAKERANPAHPPVVLSQLPVMEQPQEPEA